jgi:hypothetical protein
MPGGAGTVTFAAGAPPTYTITVQWQEQSLGAMAQTETITIQVPNF